MSLTLKGFLFIQNGQKRKLSIGSAALICRTNLFWLIEAPLFSQDYGYRCFFYLNFNTLFQTPRWPTLVWVKCTLTCTPRTLGSHTKPSSGATTSQHWKVKPYRRNLNLLLGAMLGLGLLRLFALSFWHFFIYLESYGNGTQETFQKK